MTQPLLVPTSSASHAKKGFVGVGLSYELSNMHLTNMNMACYFWLILQANETPFKERYIIKGDEIVGGGV
jgi:hypothetical protein